MTKKTLNPIHPGEVLFEEFLKPLGISQSRLALDIRVPATRINAIVHGERDVTADTALRLARYFNTSPEFWMGLQTQYDLDVQSRILGAALEVPEAATALDAHVVLGHRPLEFGQGYLATQAQKAVFQVIGKSRPKLQVKDACKRVLEGLTLLHALQFAIAKWEVIEASFGTSSPVQINGGPRTCALCLTVDGCEECPVAWKAGMAGCHNTPYYDFGQHPTRQNAAAELHYLRLVYDDLYFGRISREAFDGHDYLDSDGYPTQEALVKIESWAFDDPWGLIKFMEAIWHFPEHGVRRRGNKVELHTGGWSGNEELITSLTTTMFWMMYWQCSRRGGYYYFELPAGDTEETAI